MGKLQVQVDRLYRLLDEELENFHKDERFFSVQKIMDRYQVNLRVVNGALDRLENAGAIRRERYRGIFCRETRHPDISSILLIMPDFPGAELDSFAELVRNHITEYPEFRLQLQRFLKNDIDKPPSEEVAAILPIDPRAYGKYERGERGIPVLCVAMLADYYKTSMDYILEHTNNPAPYSGRGR